MSYEKRNGPLRLVRVFQTLDDREIEIVAHYLRYIPSQLKEDINALHDYVEEVEEERREDREAEEEDYRNMA